MRKDHTKLKGSPIEEILTTSTLTNREITNKTTIAQTKVLP